MSMKRGARCRPPKYAVARTASGLHHIQADVCRGPELGMGAGVGCDGQRAGLEWLDVLQRLTLELSYRPKMAAGPNGLDMRGQQFAAA